MKIIIFSHQVAYLHTIFHWVQSIIRKLPQLPKLYFHASMPIASYLWLMSPAQFISYSIALFSLLCVAVQNLYNHFSLLSIPKERKLMKSPYNVCLSLPPYFGIWTRWLIFTKLCINVTSLEATQWYFSNFLQSIIQRWQCAELLMTLEPLIYAPGVMYGNTSPENM
jgi:hypothetical protein